MRVADLITVLDELAPFQPAEEWDNVGLLVGHRGREVSKVLIGLDPTSGLLDEAVGRGVDTIITHHPVIFRPLAHILTDQTDGALIEKALAHGINLIGCHTNLDSCSGGVNDALAAGLGLVDLRPLQPASDPKWTGVGMGRIGRYLERISSRWFMQRVLKVLDLGAVQVAGSLPEEIRTVGLCGGSGSDLAPVAQACGADVYLSAEIKHSTGRWAEECGFCVIDGTHYGTENPVVRQLAARLRGVFQDKGWSATVAVSESQRPPFFIYNDNEKVSTTEYESR